MTFQTGVWAVDGNEVDANFARLMLMGSTALSQGVVGPLDCIVNATSPATAGILITSGSVVIYGAETAFQGSYYAENVGTDSTLTIAATGGSPRSDMIVARAEDPTWSGSPWSGAPANQIVYPRVISGVAPGSTSPPGGQSCIPLARIDMPANTATVQQSYITDLRPVVNQMRQSNILYAAGPATGVSSETATSPIQWPTGASWSVFIPSWATQMNTFWSVNELFYNGSGIVTEWLYPVFGLASAPVLSFPQVRIQIEPGTAGTHTIVGGQGQTPIPASLRSTTQTLQFAQYGNAIGTGTVEWQQGCSAVLWYEFIGAAALS